MNNSMCEDCRCEDCRCAHSEGCKCEQCKCDAPALIEEIEAFFGRYPFVARKQMSGKLLKRALRILKNG